MKEEQNIDGKGFGWQVFALAVMLIIALSAVIFFGIRVVVEGAGITQLAVLLLSVAVAVYSVLRLISLNRHALSNRLDSTLEGLSVFIAKWEIPAPMWEEFTENTFLQSKKEARPMGVTVGVVFAFVFMLIMFRGFSFTELVIWAGLVFLFFFVLTFVGVRIKTAKNFQKDMERGTGEVQFSDGLIIYNGEMIYAEKLGSMLVSFSVESRFSMNTVVIEVIGGYSRRGRRKYVIPVPEAFIEVANELPSRFPPTITPKNNEN